MPTNERLLPLHVTRPSLPPFDEFVAQLKRCFDSGFLTSGPKGGPLANELEAEISAFLGTGPCVVLGNGTIALELAIDVLDLKGEIITTPFTYVATSSSILWRGCKPVFADIDPETLNIDPRRIAEKVTDRTVAIMAVHVFGQPCDIEGIDRIAKQHSLKVIYDAAHCFGSTYRGKSVFTYGDLSTLSFQATKIFQTAEGGAVFCSSGEVAEKLKVKRIFGLNRDGVIVDQGVNAKMSELNAAMGLALIKHMGPILENRKAVYRHYLNELSGVRGIRFQKVNFEETNCSYFPVLFETEEQRNVALKSCHEKKIYPRIYFDTSLETVPYLADGSHCEISRRTSRTILCLPIYNGIQEQDVSAIARSVKDGLR